MENTLDRILSDQKSKGRLSLLIGVSLFAAAAVLLAVGQVMGWVFLGMSAVLGAALWQRVKRNRQELAKLGDPETAKKELRADGTAYYQSFGLTVCRRYCISERPSLQVLPFEEMEKFEVGLAGDARKVLFLTDKNGVRHPVAETVKDDGNQEEFDRAYQQIRTAFVELKQ